MLTLGILVSGRGSNMEAIMNSIECRDLHAKVGVVISNKEKAVALRKAESRGINSVFINPKAFDKKEEYEEKVAMKLEKSGVDLVVLAGYMMILGSQFIREFKSRIINIHPSLLPAFKGLNAQKQALEYGVKYTGCTVHFVDEGVDTGPIIAQRIVEVHDDDTVDSLSQRILEQEHIIFPKAISLYQRQLIDIDGRRVKISKRSG